MPVETEAKMKVDDLAAVARRLTELGAKAAGEVLEVNHFFDTEDRSLLKSGKGVRLRVKHDLAGGPDRFILTFKGPQKPGKVKNREEDELAVENDKDAIVLLDRLGFKETISFQKRRKSWKFGGCSIELDEVPYLGSFVEIEGPSESIIMAIRSQLGLDNCPLITTSYVAMLAQYVRDHGIQTQAIEF